MTVLATALDTASAEYAAHREALLGKIDALDAEHAKALAGGGEKYVERHRGAASSSPANASNCCWTRTRPSWSCRRSPHGGASTRWAPR